jgi:hypothetical protein
MNKSTTPLTAIEKIELIAAYRAALRNARNNPSISREDYKAAMVKVNAEFTAGTITARTWSAKHDELFAASTGVDFTFDEWLLKSGNERASYDAYVATDSIDNAAVTA